MTNSINSYWNVIEPLFEAVKTGEDPEDYLSSIANISRPALLLFAAHMCVAEIHNGGFLQLFWNSTGVLVPEGIEGLTCIGMPEAATLLKDAASLLGFPYPRNRDERWDALLEASGLDARELGVIAKTQENFYLVFVEATKTLSYDNLNLQFWDRVAAENGGFQEAAARFAHRTSPSR